jgi:ISXO2-like transposase domain
VLVVAQRKGMAKARRVASHGVDDIAPRIFAGVSPDAILSPDELPAYRWIGRKLRGHARVHHASGQYVRDDARTGIRAHVNRVESFNSQIKRAIIGVWHWFSVKQCNRYLTEITFRWNHRKADFDSRIDLALVSGKRLPWKALVR